MSADTPTPESVTLTDGEDQVLTDWWMREGGDHEALALDRLNAVVESILAVREQALREEIGEPHAYGVEVLVNAGRPSEYWRLEMDEGPRETEEDAEHVRDMMLAEGYRLDHLRIVALTVVRGAR